MKNFKHLFLLTSKLTVVAMCAAMVVGCAEQNLENLSSQTLLSDGWAVQSSQKINANGVALSQTGLDVSDWYSAKVPSTVMATLVDNGLYKDLFVGDNYTKASRGEFNVSWWYRTEFDSPKSDELQNVMLQFDGVTYRANVWLNGVQIASKDDMFGPFRMFGYDVTGVLKDRNALAVEIFRAEKGEPNIGFVDWNPRPLDENMGIFREVRLVTSGSVSMSDTWVRPRVNTDTYKEAWLSVETMLNNFTKSPVEGKLVGEIEGKKFSVPIALAAGENKKVIVTADDAKCLHVKNPRLWWCNNMGEPNMYNIDVKFVVDDVVTSAQNIDFGIRHIESYFDEDGHRGFKLNGQNVLIKSAGWTDDIFLRDNETTNDIQARYVKDMNLNSIRFENVWGTNRNIYDLCDKYGLLALVGWSCQWEWENYIGIPDDEFGAIKSSHDMWLLTESMRQQVIWLRNNPSVFVWMVGSDKLPMPEHEKMYVDLLPQISDMIYLAAAAMRNSEVSGSTGVKMMGPYEYVAPNYWYVDKRAGGAYGFNTETGPGSELPVEESIAKMIPEDKLWPISKEWDYHCTTAAEAFNKMNVTTEAITNRYGEAKNLKEYLDRAHLLSYESVRAMFEAFRVNKNSGATGVVQWMLNSAWPSMYWQLYDYYLIPTSAYYATKKGNEPLQLIYNYGDNYIYALNATMNSYDNLKANVKGYSIDSEELYAKDKEFSIGANDVVKLFEVVNDAKNSMLFLSLCDSKQKQITDNFYLLASEYDKHDWRKSSWWGIPMEQYADYKDVATIESAAVLVEVTKNGNKLEAKLTNKSNNIAMFVHLLGKDKSGEVLYPVFWNDNYVTLQPNEVRVLECDFGSEELLNKLCEVKVSGWNTGVNVVKVK